MCASACLFVCLIDSWFRMAIMFLLVVFLVGFFGFFLKG